MIESVKVKLFCYIYVSKKFYSFSNTINLSANYYSLSEKVKFKSFCIIY